MSKEVMMKQVDDDDVLNAATAIRYLNLYTGEADWNHHIGQVWGRLSKKYGEDQAKVLMRKTIACTILLPLHDRTKVPELPENLLYWVPSYQQFNDRDWDRLLKDLIQEDAQIEQWRNQSLSLGIIYPLEYSPVTRQAFNWLYTQAEDAGVITPENKADMTKRFRNLVLAYGGNVICSIFLKEKHRLKKVLNWRTGYFFERIIFETYKIDQVLKIKKMELAKTNPGLVKQLRND